VDQRERGYRFVGELEERDTNPVANRAAAHLGVAQGGLEIERAVQVGDAVGDEERLHAASLGRRIR
jgi:hypothetical protein